ncbi:metal-dependent hydrolase [Ramlibacter tataouinensis]|uniref:metal-dependent hydrolase n=1 Tax=Ramlibacter tataouinensis TaxID=94132 RepID=UPI0022F3F502|nr:metal-dependent hydrolase [Ramlibacter tataouinensis]WBX99990.1 metal-dependent hydrolase [Ramlibacter tataouinensis]
MDSISQLALGAAVGVAVMGRRSAVWKAALAGGIAGTLPDLDAFIDHGNAVANMTYHRAESHALFWLTLASPLVAALVSRVAGEADRFRRWWLALWLALVTHPLLDTLTIYGTQLLLPFTDHPFGVGSIFIIDPLYTVPLLIGLAGAVARGRGHGGLRWNAWALGLSTAYLAWSVGAQAHVRALAQDELAAAGRPAEHLLVTPTPFNTVLWRIVAMRDGGYEEGFHSLLDGRPIRFERFASDRALERELQDLWPVQRMQWFTHGFYRMQRQGDAAYITDLRMGQEPNYSFNFRVGRREGGRWEAVPAQNRGARGDLGAGLRWLWRRMGGEDLPPPR